MIIKAAPLSDIFPATFLWNKSLLFYSLFLLEVSSGTSQILTLYFFTFWTLYFFGNCLIRNISYKIFRLFLEFFSQDRVEKALSGINVEKDLGIENQGKTCRDVFHLLGR